MHARRWVTELTHWYNHEHRHSAIGFVTPEQRHAQMDTRSGAHVLQSPPHWPRMPHRCKP
ncbi:MAG: hypothetical protein H7293_18195 [Candidatus Saccharibacteria bacterium]|nr:hypothetical protein [Rhodoferax sp.]